MIKSILFLVIRQRRTLVTLAVILAVTEIAVRLIAPDYVGRVFTPKITGGHAVAVSNKGYRVATGFKDHDKADLRILAIGDSVTFGTGVSYADTWPARLEKALERQSDRSVVVHNAGLQGTDVRQLSRGVFERWSDPKPDAIVMAISANMVPLSLNYATAKPRNPVGFSEKRRNYVPSQSEKLKNLARQTIQNTGLWGITQIWASYVFYHLGFQNHLLNPKKPFAGPLTAYGWQQTTLPKTLGEDVWTTFEDHFSVFNDKIKQSGIPFLLVFVPPRFVISDHKIDNLKNVPKTRFSINAGQRMNAMADRLDVPFIDLTHIMGSTRTGWLDPVRLQLYAAADYTHLNGQGAEVLARVVAPQILQTKAASR